MPKPAGNAPLDQSVPPSVVLTTTPGLSRWSRCLRDGKRLRRLSGQVIVSV